MLKKFIKNSMFNRTNPCVTSGYHRALDCQPSLRKFAMMEKFYLAIAKHGFWLLSVCLINACALTQTDKPVEHGFSVANKGDTLIRNVIITYGKERVPFCQPHCLPKGGGGGWFAPMPIQPEMQVSWQTADGQSHQAQVVVKAKVKDLSLLKVLFLEFRNESLTIKQGALFTNPYLHGFDESPLYP